MILSCYPHLRSLAFATPLIMGAAGYTPLLSLMIITTPGSFTPGPLIPYL